VKRRALLIVALCALAAAPPAAAAAKPNPLKLSPLHAQPDPANGGRIVDARGRTVLLRGVNVNAFAEYWKGSAFPTTFPLERKDPERIAGIGWNAVRLLVSWSRVEPQPGKYDDAYLAQVAAAVKRFRAVGVYTIVDFHQDAWGASLAAPDGTICPPGSDPALGWDGAPAWATIDGGLPRCQFAGTREANAAVRRAWTAFFGDEQQIQSRYVNALAHVAKKFKRTDSVAGYDLMNEPNSLGPADDQQLSAFYGRALKAIRAAGSKQLVFFEPSILFSATGKGAPPDFARDRDVVYAPHIYTGGFDGGDITADAFTEAKNEAKGFGGAPVLSGEWGADPSRIDYFQAHQKLQDEFGFSATLWTWRESCGDPHKVGEARAGGVPKPWGEFNVDCKTNKVTSQRTDLIAALARGYVRAAPGRFTTSWNGEDTLVASGDASKATRAPVIAFFPGKPKIKISGNATPPTTTRGPGGTRVVEFRPKAGPWSLRLSPAPGH
jgi:endoglycosylceramidase